MSAYTLLHDAEASADPSSTPEPFKILTKHISFSNHDEHEWWHKSGPMMARMLVAANYDIHQQYRYLCLYALHIVPMMGPFPSIDRPQLYKTPFTSQGTLEISTNFMRSRATLRMSIEPIDYRPMAGLDAFNRVVPGQMLNRLKQAGVKVDMSLYHQLIHRLTLSDEEDAALRDCDGVKNLPYQSQSMVALDFGNEDAMVKLYLFPGAKAHVTGTCCSDLIFSAVKTINADESFKDALAALESYCLDLPASAQVHWISVDLVKPTASRCKIYVFDGQVDFERVSDFWTMGGKLASPGNSRGLGLLRELWDALDMSGDLHNQNDTAREFVCLLANYELQPGRSLPEPKIYINLSGISDLGVAKTVSSFIERHVNTEQGRAYIDNVASFV
ncbi:cyclo-L-Trp-L-Trp prenyltransferase [Aspergillus affinis]|uniref:cyclo-L-Trp-L-Trp prenyltransferase n=1 Tax=Aspergillus affinis TaxID=1070780 RepID=UPI0022FE6AEB|nr:cyclo-L-Trp-L-Trp prenyltransferase [Aspergillus affinis]KAI9042442.1 cyclo-L-Trp-L-Trp prenyltransferase [Aspergillus affinis]